MDSKSASASTMRFMNLAQNAMNKSQQRLSSGLRINTAADDAAGLAIVGNLDAVVAELNVGTRNAGYGESMANIADSAMSGLTDIMTRMGELANQSANGTYSDEQRKVMNDEYQSLSQEAQRITATTTFNGVQIFGNSETQIQVGTDSSENSRISITGTDVSNVISNLAAQDISTQAGAQQGLDVVNNQIQNLAGQRGNLGATMSRLGEAENNNMAAADNFRASAGRIRDADIADEAANYTANSIKTQSGTAMLAQANVTQQMVLRLLG